MDKPFDNFTISGFRAFKTIELNKLGQINIIVGDNNSGKTSLLEAIFLFCSPLDPRHWFEVSKRSISSSRFLSNLSSFRPDIESIRWIFHHHNNNYENILIKSNGKTPITQLNVELSDLYVFDENDGQQLSFPFGSEELDDEVTLTNTEKEGLEMAIQVKSLSDSLEKTQVLQFVEGERFIYRKKHQPFIETNIISPAYYHSISTKLSRLILSNKQNKKELLNLLQIFDPNINDIMLLSPNKRSEIYIEHQQLGITPLDIFGDGMKKTLTLALAILSTQKGVLLIDEIETSIHISALKEVFSWLVKSCFQNNIQIFLTTHSLEAVDTMIQSTENIDDIVAFQFNDQDNTNKRLSGDLLSRIRLNRGLDIR
ncbi:AAA family ATPase [Spirulina sp. CS-785/01]|uniref:AAA family ATPase n=1 Tax=Spirulina sp. CS-785/01 TaxID=3021716 RepID=UPI00232D90C7|nr:ATP-binding protein [Spirulina sp. CS-785/01]MDB9315800.1 AAA family ATPase [Spirulina sp. CS-785/01]